MLITYTHSPLQVQHALFIPPADPEETMWSVAPPSLEEAEAAYDSDSIRHNSSLASVIAELPEGAVIHTLPLTTDYPALPEVARQLPGSTSEHLLEALHRARLTKTPHEIELLREANRISSQAHEVLMRELGRFARVRVEGGSSGAQKTRTGKESVTEWEVESENDAQALFEATCKRMG